MPNIEQFAARISESRTVYRAEALVRELTRSAIRLLNEEHDEAEYLETLRRVVRQASADEDLLHAFVNAYAAASGMLVDAVAENQDQDSDSLLLEVLSRLR